MPLPSAVDRYLHKRGAGGPWRLAGDPRRGFRGAVVIPALAEETTLFATLASLRANPPAALERLLVVTVVNHSEGATAAIRGENARTLERLAAENAPGLALAWVDAASPGRELPSGGGVGLARKIGFDLVLERLDWGSNPFLVSLDADTLVRPDYLPALLEHFDRTRCGGAVLPFCHRKGATPEQDAAITLYELYQHSYALGLSLAGSPYGFPALGSALACRADAYVASGGMNRRAAGEDFYFLQQLVKTAGVDWISGTVVHPSPRVSRRTPFGTGRSILRLLAGDRSAVHFHPVGCYRLLADWLRLAAEQWQRPTACIVAAARDLHPVLGDFLERERFSLVWPRLQRQHRSEASFMAAFHCWFDGLKTRQLLHRLSVGPFPAEEPEVALPPLLRWAGLPPGVDLPSRLQLLRGCENRCVYRKRCDIVDKSID